MSKQNPPWQPISMLPVFTDMIDGILESSIDQLANLRQVENKPHVLDDETVQRIIRLYTEQLEGNWVVERQLEHWKHSNIEDGQLQEVIRLITQTSSLKKHSEEILALAHSIEHGTIDKIMAMDDAELGIAVLSGKMKPPYTSDE